MNSEGVKSGTTETQKGAAGRGKNPATHVPTAYFWEIPCSSVSAWALIPPSHH